MNIDPEAREKKSLDLLNIIPWDTGAVVIGGYSILGYDVLRYSDDLDIVAPKNSLGALFKWFNYNGYQTVKTAIPNPQNYDGNFIRFSKDEVTVDLLIGAVRDRDAQVDIPASWITRSSVRKKVKGFNYSTSIDVRLARPEALWGLKIQAGRDQDLTDLYSIHDRKFKIGEVTDLFEELMSPNLKKKLTATRERVLSPKLYSDTRSKLGLKDTKGTRADWERYLKTVCSIVDESCK